jgi:hypothetical protein
MRYPCSRSWVYLTSVLAAVALIAHALWFRRYVTDDAFISFRYLQNLFGGDGLVYNPGERVWGYSNFLWIACVAPVSRLVGDDLLAARILGVLCSAASVGAAIAGVRVLGGGRRSMLLCGGLIAANGAYAMQAVSGLETGLFSLLVVAALVAHAAALRSGRLSRLVACWVLLALATLTRPEGLFVFGVVIAGDLLRAPRPLKRLVTSVLVAYAPIVVVYAFSMRLYYGAWYPNSIAAKVGLSAEQVVRGLRYTAVFAVHYPIYVLLIALALAHRRRLEAGARSIVEVCLLLLFVYTLAGGDWMPGYRLYQPLVACAAILVVVAFRSTDSIGRIEASTRRALQAAAAVFFVALTLAGSRFDPHVYGARFPSYVHDGIRVGQWMTEHLPADALLATNTGGTIPYYSGLAVVDMMGLNDARISRRENPPPEWKGIEKGDGAYVLSREPDYIQFGSATGGLRPTFLSDIEIYASREFMRWYDAQEYVVDDDLLLVLYARRETPRDVGVAVDELRERREVAREAMARSRFRY